MPVLECYVDSASVSSPVKWDDHSVAPRGCWGRGGDEVEKRVSVCPINHSCWDHWMWEGDGKAVHHAVERFTAQRALSKLHLLLLTSVFLVFLNKQNKTISARASGVPNLPGW